MPTRDDAVEEQRCWAPRDRAAMAKARKHPQGPFVAAEERSLLGFHHRRGGSVASAYGDDDDLPDLAEADVWYTQSFGGECGSSRRRRTRAGNRRGGGGGKHKVSVLSRMFTNARRGCRWRPPPPLPPLRPAPPPTASPHTLTARRHLTCARPPCLPATAPPRLPLLHRRPPCVQKREERVEEGDKSLTGGPIFLLINKKYGFHAYAT